MHTFKPIRQVAPSQQVVTISEMKAQARIDVDDENELLETYIAAAINHVDGYSGVLGRCLVSQTWKMGLTDWPKYKVQFPFPDVSSVELSYFDQDEVSTVVHESQFEIAEASCGSLLLLKDNFEAPTVSQESPVPISIQFVAGYGTAAQVPNPIKVAIMMLAAHWYENRGASGSADTLPFGVSSLLMPYRMVGL